MNATDALQKYKSPDCIAQLIFDNLKPKDIKEIRSVSSPDGMIAFHHTVGQYIRNNFLLWDVNNPYTKRDCSVNGEGFIDDPLHPDEVSHEILKKVWELVNAN